MISSVQIQYCINYFTYNVQDERYCIRATLIGHVAEVEASVWGQQGAYGEAALGDSEVWVCVPHQQGHGVVLPFVAPHCRISTVRAIQGQVRLHGNHYGTWWGARDFRESYNKIYAQSALVQQ